MSIAAKQIEKLFLQEIVQLAIPASILALLAWLWNTLFLNYIDGSGFSADIFRPAFRKAMPPIYGQATPIDWQWFIGLSLMMCSVLILFPRLKHRLLQQLVVALSVLFLMFLFAQTEGRFATAVAHYSTYVESISAFSSPLDVVQQYTERQATLNVHSAHYPPGNLWLIKCFDQYASVAILKYFFYALVVLSFMLLFSLVEQVSLIPLLTIPALLIYPSLDVVALPFFFFSIALFVQFKIESPLWKSLLLGVVSSVWLFFSFSVFVFWLFLFVKEVLAFFKVKALKPSIVYHLVHPAVIIVFFSVLSILFHFSIIQNFKIALSHNIHINSNYFDDPIRFLFRSTGNALEFFLGVGFPSMLLFRKNKSLQPRFLELRNTFLLTLVIASCCGLFFMETDRVWFFFIPLVILIANEELQNSSLNFSRIFSFLAVLYAVWFELSAIHFC